MSKDIRKQTELQKLASNENYALFQLFSTLGNLYHISKVSDTRTLEAELRFQIEAIKYTQRKRKSNET